MSWLRASVVERKRWAADLITLTLDVVVERHVPGQFVNVALDLGGERVRRSYSLANAPGTRAELYLSLVPGGGLTPALFELGSGGEAWVDDRALGFFTLDHVPEARDLWLLGTGSGLGPFVSILRTEEPWRRFERIVLVHGVRRSAQLGYARELESLGDRRAGRFAYVPLVTREEPPTGGLRGRIPALLDSGALEARAGLPLLAETSHVMLCGNPAMIADAQDVLAQRGMQKHRKRKPGHVTIESYW